MLPPFVIDQIRRREQREKEERARYDQPRVELPWEQEPHRKPAVPEEDEARGVVILNL